MKNNYNVKTFFQYYLEKLYNNDLTSDDILDLYNSNKLDSEQMSLLFFHKDYYIDKTYTLSDDHLLLNSNFD